MREGLELCEDLREEAGVGVDAQHAGAQRVDDPEAAVPEPVLVVLHKERLERVADLVAHVRVGEIEAGEDGGLQFVLRDGVLGHQVAHQHVDEHDVGGVDESDVLPALQEQRAVHGAQPHDGVPGLELLQAPAAVAQELAQTLEELARGSLDYRLLGARDDDHGRGSNSVPRRQHAAPRHHHIVVVVLENVVVVGSLHGVRVRALEIVTGDGFLHEGRLDVVVLDVAAEVVVDAAREAVRPLDEVLLRLLLGFVLGADVEPLPAERADEDGVLLQALLLVLGWVVVGRLVLQELRRVVVVVLGVIQNLIVEIVEVDVLIQRLPGLGRKGEDGPHGEAGSVLRFSQLGKK